MSGLFQHNGFLPVVSRIIIAYRTLVINQRIHISHGIAYVTQDLTAHNFIAEPALLWNRLFIFKIISICFTNIRCCRFLSFYPQNSNNPELIIAHIQSFSYYNILPLYCLPQLSQPVQIRHSVTIWLTCQISLNDIEGNDISITVIFAFFKVLQCTVIIFKA